MKRFKSNLLSAILVITIFSACHKQMISSRQSVAMFRVIGNESNAIDSGIVKMIEPYKERMSEKVNLVIGRSDSILLRDKPEGTLGNMVADAVMESALSMYKDKIDLVVVNSGGLRIASIGAGKITAGKMLELMPFENEITILKIRGLELKKLFELIAQNEGWPIKGGFCKIKNRQCVMVKIGNDEIVDDKIYTLATNDYLANGGDNASCLLNPVERKDTGIKIRDAISQFVSKHSPLRYSLEGRIIKE